ncbi:Transcription initiation factor TFIIB [uncultured virus]|nr:Transcription initiation factor TFIIB [uncultured virus]
MDDRITTLATDIHALSHLITQDNYISIIRKMTKLIDEYIRRVTLRHEVIMVSHLGMPFANTHLLKIRNIKNTNTNLGLNDTDPVNTTDVNTTNPNSNLLDLDLSNPDSDNTSTSDSDDSTTNDPNTDSTNANAETCTNCGNIMDKILDSDSGNIICNTCGMMSETVIDYHQDCNASGYSQSDSFMAYSKKSTTQKHSTIAFNNKHSKLWKKHTWYINDYKYRTLAKTISVMRKFCTDPSVEYVIPKSVIDKAIEIYEYVYSCRYTEGIKRGKPMIKRGGNSQNLISGSFNVAAYVLKKPRTEIEIAKIFQTTPNNVIKGTKNVCYRLSLVKFKFREPNEPPIFSYDVYYMQRYGERLQIPQEDIDLAITMFNNCCKLKIASEHNDTSLSSTIMILMAKIKGYSFVTKNIVAKMFGTSKTTMIKLRNMILPYLDIIVSDEITDHIMKAFAIAS